MVAKGIHSLKYAESKSRSNTSRSVEMKAVEPCHATKPDYEIDPQKVRNEDINSCLDHLSRKTICILLNRLSFSKLSFFVQRVSELSGY